MKINHVQHIAINTKDIEASVAFYRDVMGLPFASKADMGGEVLHYIQVSGDTYIELFDLKGRVKNETVDEDNAGLRHLAFDVDSVAEWSAYLKEKGVPFVLEITEMPLIGKRAILVEGPDGVVLELCENL